jgi:hypothetical protein
MWISKKEYLELHQSVQESERRFSVLHEIVVRLVEQKRVIEFDFLDEIPDGRIVWDTVQTEAGTKQMSIWFAATEKEGKVHEEVPA